LEGEKVKGERRKRRKERRGQVSREAGAEAKKGCCVREGDLGEVPTEVSRAGGESECVREQ